MDIETIFKDIMENLDQYSLETQTFIKQKYLPLLNRCNQVEHFLQQTANICQTEPELRRFGKILAAEDNSDSWCYINIFETPEIRYGL